MSRDAARGASGSPGAQLRHVRKAVVNVDVVSDAPDYDQPWQTLGVLPSSGSGAIVATSSGPRVLTNAHVVENQVFVEVRRFGSSRHHVAEVEAVGHECDLALLSVSDAAFFRGVEPLQLGILPTLGDAVTVLGFPVGGNRLGLTEGVVSRVEMLAYEQSQRRLLGLQIDAAINAGNSGGPVLVDGKLVGVAFQALEEAENVGYVIAAPVVVHFLRDLDDGVLDGFPHLGVVTQSLESPAHRQALELGRKRRGILVTHVVHEGSAWGVLEPGDVLLEVGGVSVAPDGTVPFGRGARIDFIWVVSQRHVGETLPIRVWRKRREQTLEVTLQLPRYLVAEDRYDIKPTYFIHAGLLFVPLSRDYLKTWGEDWPSSAPHDLMAIYEQEVRTRDRQEVVVLQKVLADQVNRGYHDLEHLVIDAVDGQPVRTLADLVRVVSKGRSTFTLFKARDDTQIVVDRAEAAERKSAILRRYGIASDRSADIPGG